MTTRNDLSIYEQRASEWWDPTSRAFRSLHSVNALREALLAGWLGDRLRGARTVDLGCGGGVLARGLARRGARIVGIDRSPKSLLAAAEHVAGSFLVGDLRAVPLRTGVADVAILADVLEHVEEPRRAVAEAARVLKPGGMLYVNTINRTRRARWLAVHLAEGLGLVPRGTHDPALFVTPAELRHYGEQHGLQLLRIQGEPVRLLRTLRRWTIELAPGDDVSVSYSALFSRGASA